MTNEIKLFDITDIAIKELKDKYGILRINGLDDNEGYKIVKAARIDMKGYRVAIDKRRKELNEDALKHQRKINTEAKRITEKLSEIENYLANQEKVFDDMHAAIKLEEEKKLTSIRQDRIDKLLSVGFRYNGHTFTHTLNDDIQITDDIGQWDEDRFLEFYTDYKVYFEACELKRIEAEKEQARIAAEIKAEQDRVKAFLDTEKVKLAVERSQLIKQQEEMSRKIEGFLKKESEFNNKDNKISEVKIKTKDDNKKHDELNIKQYSVEVIGIFKAYGYYKTTNKAMAEYKAFIELNDEIYHKNLKLNFESETINIKEEITC